MKRLLSLLALAALSLSMAKAQDVFINIDELPSMTSENISLGNKGAAVFIGSDDRFVITSSNPGDVCSKAESRDDGRYAYRVEADLGSGRERTFIIKRAGTALQAEKKMFLNAGESIFFEIKEAEHRIKLNKQVTRDMLYPVAGKACLEFITPIPNSQLRFSDKIGGKLTRRSEEGGVEVLALEIDIASLEGLKSQAADAENAYEDFEKRADAAEEFTDAMMEEEKKLEQARDEARQTLAEALSVSLYSERSNEVFVGAADMEQLSSKLKLKYGVLDTYQKVGTTPFAQKLIDANQAFLTRRYKEAAALYQEAGQDPDATEDERANCEAQAASMTKCAETREEANRTLLMIKQYKAQGEAVNPDKLVDLFNLAINQNEQLFILTDDDYFQYRMGSLKESRDKIGLVVRGTVLTTRIKQGVVREEPLIGIDIYGLESDYYGYMSEGIHGEHLGSVTNIDGSFQLQIPRGKYKGLLFVPTNNKSYKRNVWQDLGGNTHTQLKIRFKK